MALSAEHLTHVVPSYASRRALLAKDSLASVDGFKVMVILAYEHLFGMRVCFNCPHCNHDVNDEPCQDCFGSNAKPEGGVFGRIDAGYTSIEAQKSKGDLHAHSQLFVQCLHQHTPLIEVLQRLRQGGKGIVDKCLQHRAHVCRQICADPALAEERLPDREKEWPEYK